MSIAISGVTVAPPTTISRAGNVVTIDAVAQPACANLAAIVITGDLNVTSVAYSGTVAPAITVTANLGAGDDVWTTAGAQPVTVNGGPDNDMISGGDGNDTLAGNDGNDTLNGGGGDDLIRPGTGAGSATGGEATETNGDVVAFDDIPTPVGVTLTLGGASVVTGVTGDSTTQIAEFENATGGAGRRLADGRRDERTTLIGNAGNDTLAGLGGDDALNGGAGDDTLKPGTGAGTATGGETGETTRATP